MLVPKPAGEDRAAVRLKRRPDRMSIHARCPQAPKQRSVSRLRIAQVNVKRMRLALDGNDQLIKFRLIDQFNLAQIEAPSACGRIFSLGVINGKAVRDEPALLSACLVALVRLAQPSASNGRHVRPCLLSSEPSDAFTSGLLSLWLPGQPAAEVSA
jgi:hypothetical protein